MALTWPWALLALLAFPALLGVRALAAATSATHGGTGLQHHPHPRGAAGPLGVATQGATGPLRAWLWCCSSVAGARPRANTVVPIDSSAILLVIDVSTSMCSSDVPPNRLTVAETAASDFVKAQHNGTRIGLVAFSGIAALLVPPTTDKDQLLDAIATLRTSRGTAIGLGILSAIDAIATINPNVPASGVDLSADEPVTGGGFEPDTIVVLTDGANTQGVDPVTAAQQAAARRLRIYTIGFGTENPAAFVCTPDQISSDQGGFGPARREPGRRRAAAGAASRSTRRR